MSSVRVRTATSADVAVLVEMIHALADYERLGAECLVEQGSLRDHLFGSSPVAEVLIAEISDDPVGFALFFGTYSTFLARPGIWLEDLFVRPEHRGRGVGRTLLTELAQLAAERGCGRVEWSVLSWNQQATGFYLGLGARLLDDWTTCRLDGEALAALADAPG